MTVHEKEVVTLLEKKKTYGELIVERDAYEAEKGAVKRERENRQAEYCV